MARENAITVDHLEYDLSRIGEAWDAQKAGPHAKITGKMRA
jgi:hypothetical protein